MKIDIEFESNLIVDYCVFVYSSKAELQVNFQENCMKPEKTMKMF